MLSLTSRGHNNITVLLSSSVFSAVKDHNHRSLECVVSVDTASLSNTACLLMDVWVFVWFLKLAELPALLLNIALDPGCNIGHTKLIRCNWTVCVLRDTSVFKLKLHVYLQLLIMHLFCEVRFVNQSSVGSFQESVNHECELFSIKPFFWTCLTHMCLFRN